MTDEIISRRLNKLRKIIKSPDEAIMITNEINVGYFYGFLKSEGTLIITESKSYLLVDFRYYEAALKYAKNCEVICFSKLLAQSIDIFENNGVKNVYIEASDISLARYNQIKKEFNSKNIDCIISDELDKLFFEIRSVKDETECKKILKAQQITEQAYFEVLNYVKPGVSERKIAIELEYLMKQKGAQDVSFDLITITGKKTSLPHGVPSDDVVSNGDFFTMDIGAVYDGYHSDTTRTVAVGYATDEMKKVYDIVLTAQLSALDKIKEGVLCSEVDKTARSIIEDNGFGKYFGHATGHGVGLEIHEAPTVSFKSDVVLREGMVITDEPGIYLPDKFGVRIEDMVCVTKNGCYNFVTLPKELIIL